MGWATSRSSASTRRGSTGSKGRRAEAVGHHHLTIATLGETIEVEDGQTILEACLRQGIWLPYACGHGRCSTCKVDILDGEVDHGHASSFALMDFERQDGK